MIDVDKPVYAIKIRGGSGRYVKRDGTNGTAGRGAMASEELAYTISTMQDQTIICWDDVASDYVARKLTPTECERLQGFPDDWTKIPYRGKPADECPDAPRYKAIGNSMAVPVMRWIGGRILQVEKIMQEISG